MSDPDEYGKEYLCTNCKLNKAEEGEELCAACIEAHEDEEPRGADNYGMDDKNSWGGGFAANH